MGVLKKKRGGGWQSVGEQKWSAGGEERKSGWMDMESMMSKWEKEKGQETTIWHLRETMSSSVLCYSLLYVQAVLLSLYYKCKCHPVLLIIWLFFNISFKGNNDGWVQTEDFNGIPSPFPSPAPTGLSCATGKQFLFRGFGSRWHLLYKAPYAPETQATCKSYIMW